MLAYYGYTVSPNQIETGEGFLICRNVPIARTGDMEYLGREIGLDSDQVIKVHRSADEVFSPAALASFEGKPVTDDHPPELLTPDIVSMYEKGHAQGIRKGSGEWDGYVIADLHIHDRTLIEAVQNGKREISCGYECEYIAQDDGTYSQHNIVGNHVAVVDRGRAGHKAAILDSDIKNKQAGRPERKKMKKDGLFLKIFGQAANGKSPEEIEQLAMDAADALGGGEPENTGGEKKEEPAADNGANLEAVVTQVVKKVLAEMQTKAPETDPIEDAIKGLEGAKAPGEAAGAAQVIPAEAGKEQVGMDAALAVSILKSVRPAVAAIKDEAQRKAVADAIIASVTAGNEPTDAAKIMQAVKDNAKAAGGKKESTIEDVQHAYDSLNPHSRKETR